ncbi:MAG: ribosomal protein L37AE/L43A [Candidatus Promineifilaceae bacterium]|jgi:ribosomal protein L37AE/L43A
MGAKVACPRCEQRIEIPDDMLGESILCPVCECSFEVEMDAADEQSTGDDTEVSVDVPSQPVAPNEGIVQRFIRLLRTHRWIAVACVSALLLLGLATRFSGCSRVRAASKAYAAENYETAYRQLEKLPADYRRKKPLVAKLHALTSLELARRARESEQYADCIEYLDRIPKYMGEFEDDVDEIRAAVAPLAKAKHQKKVERTSNVLKVSGILVACVAGLALLSWLIAYIRRRQREAMAEPELPDLQCPRCMNTERVHSNESGHLVCDKCSKKFKLPPWETRYGRNWHFRRGVKEYGPVSEYSFLTMVHNRFLSADTEVWNEYFCPEWVRARYVKDLIPSGMLPPPSNPPKLWNPNTLGGLSFLLPLFGLLGIRLAAKNWKALGMKKRAATTSATWIGLLVLSVVLFSTSLFFEEEMTTDTFRVLGGILQIYVWVWVFTDCNVQHKFVKQRVGKTNYARRSTLLHLFLWCGLAVGTFFLAYHVWERGTRSIRERDYSQSVVTIQGDVLSGSGFLCDLKGALVVLSNAHVLNGNRALKLRTIDGREVPYDAVYLAPDRDLVVFEIPESATAGFSFLPIVEDVGGEMNEGQDIVVIGDSSGRGVLKPLDGKFLQSGPVKIEVDAGFVSGNSGGPIISYAHDAVVGIATEAYAPIEVTKFNWDTEFVAKPRRFGVRVDNISLEEYITLDWESYITHLDSLDVIANFATDRYNTLREIYLSGRSVVVADETRHTAAQYVQYLEHSLPPWMYDYSVHRELMDKMYIVCQELAK